MDPRPEAAVGNVQPCLCRPSDGVRPSRQRDVQRVRGLPAEIVRPCVEGFRVSGGAACRESSGGRARGRGSCSRPPPRRALSAHPRSGCGRHRSCDAARFLGRTVPSSSCLDHVPLDEWDEVDARTARAGTTGRMSAGRPYTGGCSRIRRAASCRWPMPRSRPRFARSIEPRNSGSSCSMLMLPE